MFPCCIIEKTKKKSGWPDAALRLGWQKNVGNVTAVIICRNVLTKNLFNNLFAINS